MARSSIGNSIRRGIGFGTGWQLAQFVIAIPVALWALTSDWHPAARWLVRGLVIAAGFIALISLMEDL